MSSALYKQLCRQSILYNAWKIVKKKNSAGGIDGCSITLFEENLKGNLDKLLQDIIDKTWNPEPYLRVEILKNQSEKRQLGLLTVCDKIVQQAIKSIIDLSLINYFWEIVMDIGLEKDRLRQFTGYNMYSGNSRKDGLPNWILMIFLMKFLMNGCLLNCMNN